MYLISWLCNVEINKKSKKTLLLKISIAKKYHIKSKFIMPIQRPLASLHQTPNLFQNLRRHLRRNFMSLIWRRIKYNSWICADSHFATKIPFRLTIHLPTTHFTLQTFRHLSVNRLEMCTMTTPWRIKLHQPRQMI